LPYTYRDDGIVFNSGKKRATPFYKVKGIEHLSVTDIKSVANNAGFERYGEYWGKPVSVKTISNIQNKLKLPLKEYLEFSREASFHPNIQQFQGAYYTLTQ